MDVQGGSTFGIDGQENEESKKLLNEHTQYITDEQYTEFNFFP